MATTIRQIAKFLDNRRWKYMVDEDNFRVLTSVEAAYVEQFVIVIQLHEDGRFLQFYVPRLFGDAQEHQPQESIFHKLLALSWNTKLLQWESDLMNGEVRAAIKCPLEDAPLTEKQFNYCLSRLIPMVDQVAMPRIKAVMAAAESIRPLAQIFHPSPTLPLPGGTKGGCKKFIDVEFFNSSTLITESVF
ncbi:MAG: hypothetical protein F6K41_28745 [Symploca sp. SIO3E6]|nr:hypothetical protein [Caldora sp. SIO3E6]